MSRTSYTDSTHFVKCFFFARCSFAVQGETILSVGE